MTDRFWGFVLQVLEYCSALRWLAADTHLKLLDRAVSGALFLTRGMFECDISHRRSVAVLCMMYKIRCNPVALTKLRGREGGAGKGESEWAGPRRCHGGVAICRSSNA